jgi:aminopeptidase N
MDRKEALDYFGKKKNPLVVKGLDDKFYGLRILTINKISASSDLKLDSVNINKIEAIAKTDANRKVRAAAIEFLVENGDNKYLTLFEKAISDSSYSIAGAAFKGMINFNPENAYELAKKYSKDAEGALGREVIKILVSKGTEADFDFVTNAFSNAPLSQEKFQMADDFADFIAKISDVAKIKKGIDEIIKLRNQIPSQYRSFTDSGFKKNLDKISKGKGKEIEDYVNEVFK